jgi:hypothetical protein
VPFEFHHAKSAQLTVEVAVKESICKVTFHRRFARERSDRWNCDRLRNATDAGPGTAVT